MRLIAIIAGMAFIVTGFMIFSILSMIVTMKTRDKLFASKRQQDQLDDLYALALRLGMQDAAQWLRDKGIHYHPQNRN